MPLAGDTDSQDPPESVLALAVQLNDPVPVLRTLKLWGGVTPPPGIATKVKPICERPIFCGFGETVTVIGMVTEVEVLRALGEEPTARSLVRRRADVLNLLHSALVIPAGDQTR